MPTQNNTESFGVYFDDSGLTLTAALSKNGGPFNAVSPTITDRGNGFYTVNPIAAHRDTVGLNMWLFVSGDEKRPYSERVSTTDIESVSLTVDAVYDSVSFISDAVDSVDIGVGDMIEDLAGVVSNTETNLNAINNVGTGVSNANTSIGALSVEVSEVKGNTDTNLIAINNVGTGVSNANTSIGALSVEVSEVKGNTETNLSAINNVGTGVSNANLSLIHI